MGKAKVKVVEEDSKKWGLNEKDGKSMLKSLGLAVSGAALDWLAGNLANVDFGEYTPLVYILTPVLINLGRKILAGKK